MSHTHAHAHAHTHTTPVFFFHYYQTCRAVCWTEARVRTVQYSMQMSPFLSHVFCSFGSSASPTRIRRGEPTDLRSAIRDAQNKCDSKCTTWIYNPRPAIYHPKYTLSVQLLAAQANGHYCGALPAYQKERQVGEAAESRTDNGSYKAILDAPKTRAMQWWELNWECIYSKINWHEKVAMTI